MFRRVVAETDKQEEFLHAVNCGVRSALGYIEELKLIIIESHDQLESAQKTQFQRASGKIIRHRKTVNKILDERIFKFIITNKKGDLMTSSHENPFEVILKLPTPLKDEEK